MTPYLEALALPCHVGEDGCARLEGLLQHLLAPAHMAHGLGIIVQARLPGPVPACSRAIQELRPLSLLYTLPEQEQRSSQTSDLYLLRASYGLVDCAADGS